MKSSLKRILALTLALSMMLSFAACGGKAPSASTAAGQSSEAGAAESYEPITIQFWNGWTGSDGQVLTDLVNEFNENNQWNITVEMDISSSFADKFVTAVSAGEGPALILSNAANKYTWEGKIAEVSDIWDKTELKKSDFLDSYLASLSTEDGLFGIPFQISSYVLYWNKDLFKKAGLDPEAPPKTYEEWTEFAAKITDPNSHVYGSGLSYSNIGANACIMQCFGGISVDQDSAGKWQAHFTDNTGYKAYVDWFNNQFDTKNNPVEGDTDTMFLANQIGLYITGPWLMSDLDKSGINYGVTTLIQTEQGGKQAPANTQCFMITSDCSDAEKLAAERFIQWWHTGNKGADITTTGCYRWSNEMGFPTYYVPVMESQAYKDNKKVAAITVTDPSYCADSCAPGNFRGWTQLLTDIMVPFYNQIVFDRNTDGLLNEAQQKAEELITSLYG